MTARQTLITDADNTLWETDAVYAKAQLELLTSIEQAYSFKCAAGDRLKFVRELDQSIAARHPMGLRYPPVLLVQAIVSVGARENNPPVPKSKLFPERSDSKAAEIVAAFVGSVLDTVPQLRDGVAKALPDLAQIATEIIVLTEGDINRCERLLAAYGLIGHVHAIISKRKTVDCYTDLRHRFKSSRSPIMIGDQLDCDIEMAQVAGYTTIYFPGSFNPVWARNRNVSPDYTIKTFEQIIDILSKRGLAV